MQSSTTPVPRHHVGKSDRIKRKHCTQESQEVSPFLGCKEQTRKYNKDKRETKITKKIHKRSTALEWSVKKIKDNFCRSKIVPKSHELAHCYTIGINDSKKNCI